MNNQVHTISQSDDDRSEVDHEEAGSEASWNDEDREEEDHAG